MIILVCPYGMNGISIELARWKILVCPPSTQRGGVHCWYVIDDTRVRLDEKLEAH